VYGRLIAAEGDEALRLISTSYRWIIYSFLAFISTKC
jgi:hypothetical protein